MGSTLRFESVCVALAALMATSNPGFASDVAYACCADLEERIADLEATTARRGNGKVSLAVSGFLNEAIFFWDDGVERNTYVGTNELKQTRFRFVGDAKIASGWTAGYNLEVGIKSAASKQFSQSFAGESAVSLRRSAWFLKSKDFGKITIGRFDTVTMHLIDSVDQSLSHDYTNFEAAGTMIGAFQIRRNGALQSTKWSSLLPGFVNGTAGQSGRRNIVRYDSPEISGVTLAASWGSDDESEVVLKHKGEFGSFNFVSSIGYGKSSDPGVNGGICARAGTGDCQWWGVGAFVSHTPTGLYTVAGYGATIVDLASGNESKNDTSETRYILGGIEKDWFTLGKSNLFGEIRRDNTGFTGAFNGADINSWAAGIGQKIEAADLTLYALYRHYEGETQSLANVEESIDDFSMVVAGARLNF